MELTTCCMLLAGGSTIPLKRLWALTISWMPSPTISIGVEATFCCPEAISLNKNTRNNDKTPPLWLIKWYKKVSDNDMATSSYLGIISSANSILIQKRTISWPGLVSTDSHCNLCMIEVIQWALVLCTAMNSLFGKIQCSFECFMRFWFQIRWSCLL